MYHSLPDSYMEQYLNDNNFCMKKKKPIYTNFDVLDGHFGK